MPSSSNNPASGKNSIAPDIYHSCTRKIRHMTQKSAERQIERMMLASYWDGGELNCYLCKTCDGWHVGHVASRDLSRGKSSHRH